MARLATAGPGSESLIQGWVTRLDLVEVNRGKRLASLSIRFFVHREHFRLRTTPPGTMVSTGPTADVKKKIVKLPPELVGSLCEPLLNQESTFVQQASQGILDRMVGSKEP